LTVIGDLLPGGWFFMKRRKRTLLTLPVTSLRMRGVGLLVALMVVTATTATARANDFDDSSRASYGAVPILELYRSGEDRVRYELDSDWLLGISEGITALDVRDIASAPQDTRNRWAPQFELYDLSEPAMPNDMGLWTDTVRRGTQWFWTMDGITSTLNGPAAGLDAFSISRDFIEYFSLQTKAGFVMPLGVHWRLGGALSLEQAIGGDRPEGDRDFRQPAAAIYFGVHRRY
jgi:hypothetical protein